MTDEQLKEIRARLEAAYIQHEQGSIPFQDWAPAFADIAALLAEVERLREENKNIKHRLGSNSTRAMAASLGRMLDD